MDRWIGRETNTRRIGVEEGERVGGERGLENLSFHVFSDLRENRRSIRVPSECTQKRGLCRTRVESGARFIDKLKIWTPFFFELVLT